MFHVTIYNYKHVVVDYLIENPFLPVEKDHVVARYCPLSFSNAVFFFHMQSHGDAQKPKKRII